MFAEMRRTGQDLQLPCGHAESSHRARNDERTLERARRGLASADQRHAVDDDCSDRRRQTGHMQCCEHARTQ